VDALQRSPRTKREILCGTEPGGGFQSVPLMSRRSNYESGRVDQLSCRGDGGRVLSFLGVGSWSCMVRFWGGARKNSPLGTLEGKGRVWGGGRLIWEPERTSNGRLWVGYWRIFPVGKKPHYNVKTKLQLRGTS